MKELSHFNLSGLLQEQTQEQLLGSLSGIAVSSDDTIDTAFGTAVVTTALAHSGTSNDLMVVS
jgi:hypothetical protein